MLKSLIIFAALATVMSFVIQSGRVGSETGSAADKQAASWKKITSTQGTRGSWPSTLGKLGLFTESMSPTVDFVSDEMPSGRSKLIHSVGVIAQVKIVWDSAAVDALGYTGLFTGANYGAIRASSAIEPDFTKTGDASNFIPGVGLKFFRSGVASANFVAMHLLKPWDTFNWFKYSLSNHLSKADLPIAQNLLATKFATVSKWATHVGLSDFARYDESGAATSTPGFPFQLLLVPNPELTAMYPDNFVDDYFTQFTRDLKSGTELYSVFAIDAPDAEPVQIGVITTTSDFVTSKYADSTLFLKHQIFEEDLALHPEWTQGTCQSLDKCPVCPVDKACGSA